MCAYGVTDRHGVGRVRGAGWPRTSGSSAKGDEGWSACTPRSRAATRRSRRPPAWPRDLGVGVHIHVAEGTVDRDAGKRLAALADESWLLVHARAPRTRPAGHDRAQPAVEHEQRRRLRAARPRDRTRSCSAPTASGPTCSTSSASPSCVIARTTSRPRPRRRGRGSRTDGSWCRRPAATSCGGRTTRWIRGRSPSRTDVRAVDVEIDGEVVLRDGVATRVDPIEVRAKAAEQADAPPPAAMTD